MGVLGTRNQADIKERLRGFERILLEGAADSRQVMDGIGEVIADFLDNPDSAIRVTDITGLVMYLRNSRSADISPVTRMMLDEAYGRIMRQLLMAELVHNSELGGAGVDLKDQKPETAYFRQNRYVPENGEFELPQEGTYANLTVRVPDILMKKNHVREVLIDSEGYVKKQLREYYEDIYTDESEEIYSEAYLTALKSGSGEEVQA